MAWWDWENEDEEKKRQANLFAAHAQTLKTRYDNPELGSQSWLPDPSRFRPPDYSTGPDAALDFRARSKQQIQAWQRAVLGMEPEVPFVPPSQPPTEPPPTPAAEESPILAWAREQAQKIQLPEFRLPSLPQISGPQPMTAEEEAQMRQSLQPAQEKLTRYAGFGPAAPAAIPPPAQELQGEAVSPPGPQEIPTVSREYGLNLPMPGWVPGIVGAVSTPRARAETTAGLLSGVGQLGQQAGQMINYGVDLAKTQPETFTELNPIAGAINAKITRPLIERWDQRTPEQKAQSGIDEQAARALADNLTKWGEQVMFEHPYKPEPSKGIVQDLFSPRFWSSQVMPSVPSMGALLGLTTLTLLGGRNIAVRAGLQGAEKYLVETAGPQFISRAAESLMEAAQVHAQMSADVPVPEGLRAEPWLLPKKRTRQEAMDAANHTWLANMAWYPMDLIEIGNAQRILPQAVRSDLVDLVANKVVKAAAARGMPFAAKGGEIAKTVVRGFLDVLKEGAEETYQQGVQEATTERPLSEVITKPSAEMGASFSAGGLNALLPGAIGGGRQIASTLRGREVSPAEDLATLAKKLENAGFGAGLAIKPVPAGAVVPEGATPPPRGKGSVKGLVENRFISDNEDPSQATIWGNGYILELSGPSQDVLRRKTETRHAYAVQEFTHTTDKLLEMAKANAPRESRPAVEAFTLTTQDPKKTWEKPEERVVLRSGDGEWAMINPQYYSYFHNRYPDAEFRIAPRPSNATAPASPVTVVDPDNTLRGIIMPIGMGPDTLTQAQQFSKVVPDPNTPLAAPFTMPTERKAAGPLQPKASQQPRKVTPKEQRWLDAQPESATWDEKQRDARLEGRPETYAIKAFLSDVVPDQRGGEIPLAWGNGFYAEIGDPHKRLTARSTPEGETLFEQKERETKRGPSNVLALFDGATSRNITYLPIVDMLREREPAGQNKAGEEITKLRDNVWVIAENGEVASLNANQLGYLRTNHPNATIYVQANRGEDGKVKINPEAPLVGVENGATIALVMPRREPAPKTLLADYGVAPKNPDATPVNVPPIPADVAAEAQKYVALDLARDLRWFPTSKNPTLKEAQELLDQAYTEEAKAQKSGKLLPRNWDKLVAGVQAEVDRFASEDRAQAEMDRQAQEAEAERRRTLGVIGQAEVDFVNDSSEETLLSLSQEEWQTLKDKLWEARNEANRRDAKVALPEHYYEAETKLNNVWDMRSRHEVEKEQRKRKEVKALRTIERKPIKPTVADVDKMAGQDIKQGATLVKYKEGYRIINDPELKGVGTRNVGTHVIETFDLIAWEWPEPASYYDSMSKSRAEARLKQLAQDYPLQERLDRDEGQLPSYWYSEHVKAWEQKVKGNRPEPSEDVEATPLTEANVEEEPTLSKEPPVNPQEQAPVWYQELLDRAERSEKENRPPEEPLETPEPVLSDSGKVDYFATLKAIGSRDNPYRTPEMIVRQIISHRNDTEHPEYGKVSYWADMALDHFPEQWADSVDFDKMRGEIRQALTRVQYFSPNPQEPPVEAPAPAPVDINPEAWSAIQQPLYHVSVNRGQLLREGYKQAAAHDTGLGKNVGGYLFTTADRRTATNLENTLKHLRSAWETMGRPSKEQFNTRLQAENRPLYDQMTDQIITGDPKDWNDIGTVQVAVDVPAGWVYASNWASPVPRPMSERGIKHDAAIKQRAEAEFVSPTGQPRSYVHADIRETYPPGGIQGVVAVPLEYLAPPGTTPATGQARIADAPESAPSVPISEAAEAAATKPTKKAAEAPEAPPEPNPEPPVAEPPVPEHVQEFAKHEVELGEQADKTFGVERPEPKLTEEEQKTVEILEDHGQDKQSDDAPSMAETMDQQANEAQPTEAEKATSPEYSGTKEQKEAFEDFHKGDEQSTPPPDTAPAEPATTSPAPPETAPGIAAGGPLPATPPEIPNPPTPPPTAQLTLPWSDLKIPDRISGPENYKEFLKFVQENDPAATDLDAVIAKLTRKTAVDVSAADRKAADAWAVRHGFENMQEMFQELQPQDVSDRVFPLYEEMRARAQVYVTEDDLIYRMTGLRTNPIRSRSQKADRARNQWLRERTLSYLNAAGFKSPLDLRARATSDAYDFQQHMKPDNPPPGEKGHYPYNPLTERDIETATPEAPPKPPPAAGKPQAEMAGGLDEPPMAIAPVPEKVPKRQKIKKLNDTILGTIPDIPVLAAQLFARGKIRDFVDFVGHVPGVRGTAWLIDPRVSAFYPWQKAYVVFKNIEEIGANIHRTAMSSMNMVLGRVNDQVVQMEHGVFTKGVTPKPNQPNTSLAFVDVWEHPDSYTYDDINLKSAIKLYHKLKRELLYQAQQHGARIPVQAENYLARVVKGWEDLGKRGAHQADMYRTYETMEAGIKEGVKYSDDVMECIDATFSYLIRLNVGAMMGKVTKTDLWGATAQDRMDPLLRHTMQELKYNLATAKGFRDDVKQLRDSWTRNNAMQSSWRMRKSLVDMQELLGPKSNLLALIEQCGQRLDSLQAQADLEKRKLTADERKEAFNAVTILADLMVSNEKAEKAKLERAYQSAINDLKNRGENREEAPAWAYKGFDAWGTAGISESGKRIKVAPINASWAKGKLYPEVVADWMNKAMSSGNQKLAQADALNAALLTMKAGFDLGAPFIQNLLMLGITKGPVPFIGKPVGAMAWGKAYIGMIRAMLPPVPGAKGATGLQSYLEYMGSRRTMTFLKIMEPLGFTLEGMEYAETLKRGGLLFEFARALEEAGGKAGGAKVESAIKAVLEKGLLTRAELAFQAPLNIAKIELGLSLYDEFRRSGQLKELASFLNNVTGTGSSRATGLTANHRTVERTLLMFSPRYVRSSLAIIGAIGRGDLKGRYARRALNGLLVSGAMFTIALHLATGQPLDDPDDQWWNPFDNQHFMTTRVWGRYVGFGGIYRSLMTLSASMVYAAAIEPENLLEFSRRSNPILRWASSRTSPVTGMLINFAEGRDFLGEPFADTWHRIGANIGKSLLPMWLDQYLIQSGQELPPEEGGMIPDILGLRAQQPSASQERNYIRNRIAKLQTGSRWDQLSDSDQEDLRIRFPEIADAEREAQRQGTERGLLIDKFWTTVRQNRKKEESKILEARQKLNNPKDPISGNQYRAIVHDAEVAMAQQVIDLRNTPEFKDVPLTEEERKAYYGKRARPETNPEDLYINSYYLISDLATRPDGTVDYETLYAWRRKLKEISDPAIVAKAQTYIDRDKDKQYLEAQQVMEKLQQMPKYVNTTKEKSANLSKAMNLTMAEAQYLPPGFPHKMDYALNQVRKNYGSVWGDLAVEAYKRSTGDAPGINKARQSFAAANRKVLVRWYSDAVYMDLPELVEAGVKPEIPLRQAPPPLPTQQLPSFKPQPAPEWQDIFLRAIGR